MTCISTSSKGTRSSTRSLQQRNKTQSGDANGLKSKEATRTPQLPWNERMISTNMTGKQNTQNLLSVLARVLKQDFEENNYKSLPSSTMGWTLVSTLNALTVKALCHYLIRQTLFCAFLFISNFLPSHTYVSGSVQS